MGQKGTGRRLSDQERMEIIAKLECDKPHTTAAECARQYGVSSAAITKLMKVKDKIKQRFQATNAYGQQRKRGGTQRHAAFEEELFRWIQSETDARPQAQLTASRVQAKAHELLESHALGAFRASKGWYYRFCRRYGLQRPLGLTKQEMEEASMDTDEHEHETEGQGPEQGHEMEQEHDQDQEQEPEHPTASLPSIASVLQIQHQHDGDEVVIGNGTSNHLQLTTTKTSNKKKTSGLARGRKGLSPSGVDTTSSTTASTSSTSSAETTTAISAGPEDPWIGIAGLQHALTQAASALAHPEARTTLGDTATTDLLRSVQQSLGIVQGMQKVSGASVISTASATATTTTSTKDPSTTEMLV